MKEVVILDMVSRVFGGSVHKHLHTYMWVVSKKERLLDVAEHAFPFWKEHYQESNSKLRALFQWAYNQGLDIG